MPTRTSQALLLHPGKGKGIFAIKTYKYITKIIPYYIKLLIQNPLSRRLCFLKGGAPWWRNNYEQSPGAGSVPTAERGDRRCPAASQRCSACAESSSSTGAARRRGTAVGAAAARSRRCCCERGDAAGGGSHKSIEEERQESAEASRGAGRAVMRSYTSLGADSTYTIVDACFASACLVSVSSSPTTGP